MRKMGKYDEIKKAVLDASQKLSDMGFMAGSGGNISVRAGDAALVVTPSGIDYNKLELDDICVVDFSLEPLEGAHRPSVETGLHIAAYDNRPDVGAIVHTHQVYASSFAVINQPIPALFDEQVANLGDKVEIVPYGLSGSEDLAQNLAEKVKNRCNAFILQNHGAICLGFDLETAIRNVQLLEKTAQVYYHALSLKKDVQTIPDNIRDLLFALQKNNQDKKE